MKKTIKNTLYMVKILWRTNKPAFVVSAIVGIISAAFTPFNIWINKVLIDYLVDTNGISFKSVVMILLVLFATETGLQIIYTVLGWIWNPYKMWIFHRRLCGDLMKKSIALDLSCYDDSEFYTKYTRALKEANDRAYQVYNQIAGLYEAILRFAGVISILIVLGPIIIIFAVAEVIVGFIFDILTNKLNYKNEKANTEPLRRQDYVKNRVIYQSEYAKELRMNTGLFGIFTRKYNDSLREIMKNIKIYGIRAMWIKIPQLLLTSAIDLGKTVFMVWCVFEKRFTLGTFVALQNSSNSFKQSLNSVTNSLGNFHQSALFIDNYLEIMDYSSQMTHGGRSIDGDSISIDVENVSFSYKHGAQVLNDISLKIGAGEHIAIVGLNGSGKTTLVKLLCGLYNPSSGSVKFNGADMTEYSSKSIYDGVSTVFQDFHIFALTAAENVAKCENIDTERVKKCLEYSGMSEKINSLEKGVDTVLSTEFSGGVNLSGGEAQKLAIASAMYKDSKLLIFDEPTSALDPLMEKEIFDRIDALFGDKTTILISHRLANVIKCDRIFYMSGGVITECGTHAELMAQGGEYANLFTTQAREYQMNS